MVVDKLPYASCELLSITFWDKWKADETDNRYFVEPDVFMRYYDFDIIVEAKRYNEKQQYWRQMISQIQAYNNQYGDENKQLFYIKLGGLHHLKDEPNYVKDKKNIVICKTDWTRLLDSISTYLEKVKNNANLRSASHIRILEDCVNGFAMHQFYKKKWLSELKLSKDTNHQILKNNLAMEDNKNTLLEIRKAYRLLFDFQDRILDLMGFIGNSYNRKYLGGYPKFSDEVHQKGKGKLSNWAWDWLSMYFYLFHFGTEKVGEDEITFGVFLMADDGYFRARQSNSGLSRTKVDNFAKIEESETKLLFVIGKNYWQREGLFGEDWQKAEFTLGKEGRWPDNQEKDKFMLFKSYDLADFFTQDEAVKQLSDFSKYCSENNVNFKLAERLR